MHILGWAGLANKRAPSLASAETLLLGRSARGAPLPDDPSGGRRASLALPLCHQKNPGISDCPKNMN